MRRRDLLKLSILAPAVMALGSLIKGDESGMPIAQWNPPTEFCVMPAMTYWAIDGVPSSFDAAMEARNAGRKVTCHPTEVAKNIHKYVGWWS